VVKTLNQVGSPVMDNPSSYTMRPLQFVAADDAAAKAVVQQLLNDIGFDARDAGGLDHAVDLEAMARLWIGQTFMQGMGAHTSWALVTPA
jgi:8-hydroxy-5-deazaflavin:NADPH oxidoreductase